MSKKQIFIIILALAYSCKNDTSEVNTKDDLSIKEYSLDWMKGNWLDSNTMAFRKVSYGENWVKKDENLYNGGQYYINKGVKGEPNIVSIIKTDGLFYFTYSIGEDQHTFVQDSINDLYLRLNHLQDEFPTTLIYKLKNDALLMTREGFASGVFRSVTFKAKKLTD